MLPKRRLTILRASASAIAVGVLAAGCSRNLDMERIKASIKEGIEKQSGVAVLWVDCPPARKALPKDRFECRAGIEGGAVTLDVVQDEYANAQWTQREQILNMREVEEIIRTGLSTNLGMVASVACPGKMRPGLAGTRFACEVTPRTPATAPFDAEVVIKGVKGQIDWSIPRSIAEKKRTVSE